MAGSKEVISMEELHERRKIVRKDAGRGCRASEESSTIVVQVEAAASASSLMERFKSVVEAKEDNTIQTSNTRIYKVPDMLRKIDDYNKYFEPRVVSIGPYHHGKSELQEVEKQKLKYTKEFIDNCNEPIEVLYHKIFHEIKKLRDCYDDEEAVKEYDDNELAWMLFMDGCFVLQYINNYVKQKRSNDLNIKFHVMPLMHQDLFLLENQLPFRVLELLMSGGFEENNKGMDIIEKFIQEHINPPERNEGKP